MTFTRPLVTVYIANYNYGAFIEESIQSVLSQTYSPIELIIIDDNSSDNSIDIIDKYRTLENIRVVQNSTNLGLTKVNNEALKLSNGEYIMRLDADDYLTHDAIELMINEFRQNTNASIVFGNWYNVDLVGNIINQELRLDFKREVTLLDSPAHGACTMFRIEALRKVNGYDESISRQDGYDVWLKLIFTDQIVNIPKPLFYYRKHKESLSSNLNKLLEARSNILEAQATKRTKPLKVKGVLLIRNSAIESNNEAFERVKDKSVLTWIIDNMLSSEYISELIVVTSDESIIKELSLLNKPNVIIRVRPMKLEYLNSPITETLEFIAKDIDNCDALLLRSLKSPFIDTSAINAAINYMRLFSVQEVIGVNYAENEYYRSTGRGMTKIFNPKAELKLESEQLYRRIAGFKLIKLDSKLENERTIGSIFLDEFSSITIRDLKVLKKWSHLS